MTPADIRDFFVPVFKQAQVLKEAYDDTDEEKRRKIKMPFVTVRVFHNIYTCAVGNISGYGYDVYSVNFATCKLLLLLLGVSG